MDTTLDFLILTNKTDKYYQVKSTNTKIKNNTFIFLNISILKYKE